MKRLDLPGADLRWDTDLSALPRIYCAMFGAPIVGARIRWRRVRGLLPREARAILDAGCGRGIITRELARRYPNACVLGIDSDASLQDRNTHVASAAGLENCRFEVQDLCDWRRLESYDLIVSVDNLEHVDDDEAVLAHLYASLVPGGCLLVHVPHWYRRWPVLAWRVNFDIPGHVRPGYHMAQLKERLSRAGFLISDIGFSYGMLENLANNLSYAITGAEAKRPSVYALAFPFLNALAWFGRNTKPRFGAGVWALARKPGQLDERRFV